MTPGSSARAAAALVLAAGFAGAVHAEALPVGGHVDPRIRTAFYDPNQVYEIYGFVGFHLDLEFAPDERFVGLSAGDPKAISYSAHANVLTIRPKVARDVMNLTVTTTEHRYYFDYAIAPHPDPNDVDVMYAVQFTYPPKPKAAADSSRADRITEDFQKSKAERPKNTDYWFCGSPEIKPSEAYDDGIETYLRFGTREELPAIFLQSTDGKESLLNFTVEGDYLVLHRVARRFVLRRGSLAGCIVNKHFTGGGERLRSGTIAPDVIRERRGTHP